MSQEKEARARSKIHMIGHSHIDAAWLWPVEETIEVCKNTFSSVLSLMEKHPSFTFAQSSAQYYKWMEEHYPEVFKKIKERVGKGQWEPVGGSWVEFDCNMPSGESMVRQFLYGQRYFKSRFGSYAEVAWFPDCFGFSWTLPQIMRKAGIKYFVTHKLNWNDTVKFPYNVFWWQAPDGSKVLAYQTPGTYSEVNISKGRLMAMLDKLKRRNPHVDRMLVLFGYGDHGGGPTEEMVESVEKLMKEMPEVCFSKSVDFFKELEKEIKDKPIPTINDELYLQFHRGTYTTEAKVKSYIRRTEIMLEIAEKLSSIAFMFGDKYPKEDFDRCWLTLLFNQFHDIICGSCIKEVYERTEREFEEVSSTLKSIVNKALSLMASQVDTRGEGESIILFNALSWDRGGIVELEVDKEYDVKDERGNIVPSQMIEEGGRRKLLFLVDKVPSIGYRVLRLTPRTSKLSPGVEVKEDENTIVLENEFLRINIDKRTGLVRSIFDKINGKEVLKGQGLRIEVFKDEPREGRITLDVERPFDAVTMDAWEIYIFQRIEGVEVEPLTKPDEVKVVERGPLRAVVDVKYTYKQEGRPDTKITHRLILYRALPYLIGEVEMDCHTVHRLFKLSMDLNMYSEYVAYEIPYGAILRRNPGSPYASLYERAKWEVPAHKWLDYYDSEEHYGVALINDSKYGFDVMTHTVRMTLLRTPRYPPRWGEPWIPGAGEPMEQGMHKTRYAIYPHKGDWKEAKVYKIAYEFNYPILVRVESAHEGKLPSSMSFINIEPDHVILSAVKRAEDSEDIIIRVYEVEGKDADVKISLPKEVTGAIEVDLLERPIETSEAKVEVKGREVVFRVGHNEIKTLKLSLS